MTLSLHHLYLTTNAWQARTIAIAFGAAAGVGGGSERGRGVPQTSAPAMFRSLDSRTLLQGCNAKRPEDPGGWQEQRLL